MGEIYNYFKNDGNATLRNVVPFNCVQCGEKKVLVKTILESNGPLKCGMQMKSGLVPDWVDLENKLGPELAQKNSYQFIDKIEFNILYDDETHTKYWYIFIHKALAWREWASIIIKEPSLKQCLEGPIPVYLSHENDNSFLRNTMNHRFAGTVYFYIDSTLSNDEKKSLIEEANEEGLLLDVRDRGYMEGKRPDVFISYDSRDKNPFVNDLANKLRSYGLKVWYDSFSLNIGDSLREKIDDGLSSAKKCIIVLSKNFISNNGWTKTEFNAICNREQVENGIILPVWHQVSRDEVSAYSPLIVDKVAGNSSQGVKELARRLCQSLKK